MWHVANGLPTFASDLLAFASQCVTVVLEVIVLRLQRLILGTQRECIVFGQVSARRAIDGSLEATHQLNE